MLITTASLASATIHITTSATALPEAGTFGSDAVLVLISGEISNTPQILLMSLRFGIVLQKPSHGWPFTELRCNSSKAANRYQMQDMMIGSSSSYRAKFDMGECVDVTHMEC
jgi:hypothetical protein